MNIFFHPVCGCSERNFGSGATTGWYYKVEE